MLLTLDEPKTITKTAKDRQELISKRLILPNQSINMQLEEFRFYITSIYLTLLNFQLMPSLRLSNMLESKYDGKLLKNGCYSITIPSAFTTFHYRVPFGPLLSAYLGIGCIPPFGVREQEVIMTPIAFDNADPEEVIIYPGWPMPYFLSKRNTALQEQYYKLTTYGLFDPEKINTVFTFLYEVANTKKAYPDTQIDISKFSYDRSINLDKRLSFIQLQKGRFKALGASGVGIR